MVGRDVLGAPRPRKRPRDTSGTRAAEDVGPYHAPWQGATSSARRAHENAHLKPRSGTSLYGIIVNILNLLNKE